MPLASSRISGVSLQGKERLGCLDFALVGFHQDKLICSTPSLSSPTTGLSLWTTDWRLIAREEILKEKEEEERENKEKKEDVAYPSVVYIEGV